MSFNRKKNKNDRFNEIDIIIFILMLFIFIFVMFKTVAAFGATKEINSKKLYCPVVLQNPKLPTGCEPTALTALLMYYGYAIDKTDIVDKYMPYSKNGNPKYGFVGNPYKRIGAGCFANTITKTANNFLKKMEDPLYKAYDISGASRDDLYKILNDGNPIVVWGTMYNNYPNINLSKYKKGNYRLYDYEHCVVLYGYDKKKDIVYIMDPLVGNITRNATKFFKIYSMTGKYSSVIIDKDSKIKKWLIKKFDLEKKKPKKK